MSADTMRTNAAKNTPDTIPVLMVWHIVKSKDGSHGVVDPNTLPNPYDEVLVFREGRGVHFCRAWDVNETGVLVWQNMEQDPDDGLYGDCFLISIDDCWTRTGEIPDVPKLFEKEVKK